MLQNYFKTAFRNFQKNKLYTIINLGSLCIAITSSLLIYTYVKYELSYDDFFKNSDRIYRLEFYSGDGGELNTRYANINQSMHPNYLNSISGISKYTRFAVLPTFFLETDQKKIAEPNVWVADSNFFSIFSLSFIEGNMNTALDEPNGIVITRELAQKYFGNSKEALYKTITATYQSSSVDLTVTGIIENIPSNSHLDFDGIASRTLYSDFLQSDLSEAFQAYNYLLIEEDQNPLAIEEQIVELSETYHPGTIDYRLQPLTDIHLYSSARYEISSNSDIRYIYYLTALAAILIFITSINFTSLSTAQILQRYKEAGIRKVLGANKGQLFTIFLFEAISISLLATLIGFLVIYFIRPYFNTLTHVPFTLSDFFNFTTISLALFASSIVGTLAGIYPAILLSKFNPANTLRGIEPSGKNGAFIWKTIVVIQFASSIALIICTVIIYAQLKYIQSANLGFEKERIIYTYNPLNTEFAPLKSQLENIPGVNMVSLSSYIPGVSETGGTARVLAEGNSDTLVFNWISVDYDFFDTYEIDIMHGRTFSNEYATDSTNAFMLNEAAVENLNWESPIGKQIDAFSQTGTVIGVTDNFNYLSLYQDITPIIFVLDKNLYFNFSIKLLPTEDISKSIGKIQTVWQRYLPNIPFEYNFVEDQFNALYEKEKLLGTYLNILASFVLFISCLGLFSLSSFIAAKKQHEVAIRKVYGASISDILLTFYGNFGRLIAVATIIAIPASIYFLTNWLQNFAFRIEMPVSVFVIAIVATLVITLITVSYETIKVALSNPVDSIRGV